MRTLLALALAAAVATPLAASPTASPTPKPPPPKSLPAAVPAPSAAGSPAPAETPRHTTTTLDDLTKLLDQAGLDYHKDGDHVRVNFRWSDDRTQGVVLQPQPDIDDVPMVEIYSGVMELGPKNPLTLKTAQRLLEATGDQTLGYFGIEEVEGTPWVFCYHNLPTRSLQPQTLEKVLRLVGELADEMEKEQTGKDEF